MANILLGYWYRLYTKQTYHEELLEKMVSKLPVRYRTQHPFISQKAFADLYFPDHSLVVEVDDPGHTKPEQKSKDKKRTAALEKLGLTVIRFSNKQIQNEPSRVLQILVEKLGISHPRTEGPET